jgi:acetylornithine deacetylase
VAEQSVDFADAVALTRALTAVDSRNPILVSGAPGEDACARLLAEVVRGWGMEVEVYDAAPGRPNVVARAGARGGPALMLNGHLDVVGVEGMVHEPFVPEVRAGRIYGRGSTDMKAGVAAMCAAAARVAKRTRAEIIVTAVIDEEAGSLGTSSLIARGVRADAAIVTEPTRLAIMPAHRGFAWIEVTLTGRAAHGSRWDIGVDAVRHAGLLLAELDAHDAEMLPRRRHALLGRASLHASTIEGGTGWTTYPAHCTLRIERRTIPGESARDAVREVEEACTRIKAKQPAFSAGVKLVLEQRPSDVAADAPIVRSLEAALRASDEQVRVEGMSAWTDCALLNEAGIPAICFGPGDITLAHSAEEWVEIAEIERATTVLERLAQDFGR